MKVDVQIPDEVVAKLMALTGAKTPEEAVQIAVDEYLKLKRALRSMSKAA